MHKYSSFFKGELYEGDEGYAFISYAHRDSNIVLPIVSRLYDSGLRVWFDDGIEAGSEWPEYLAEHLANAAVVIAFVSKSFNDSKYCRREIHFATKLNKPIICIYIDDSKLSYGLEMELTSTQGFKRANYNSDVQLIQNILEVKIINGTTVASNAKQDETVEPEVTISTQKNAAPEPASKPKIESSRRKISGRIVIVTAACVIAVVALALIVCFFIGHSTNRDGQTSITLSSSLLTEDTNIPISHLDWLTDPSGEEFEGDITEDMLLGTYCQIYLCEDEYSYDIVTEIMTQYPDMLYIERMSNPSNGTAARSVASAVPYSIECKRLIYSYDIIKPEGISLSDYDLDRQSEWQRLYDDLCTSVPESADEYYDNYIEFYNTFYVSMSFYTQAGSKADGRYEYIYTIDDSVMHCSRFIIGDNNEIVYYDDANEEYNISFTDNVLTLESDDGSTINLIPRLLYRYLQRLSSSYWIDGCLYNPDNCFNDITRIYINISSYDVDGTPHGSARVSFADGGETTDAEANFNSWGNITISWYAVYHSDTNTTNAEPNSITIRVIGNGEYRDALFIIDESNNTYNYSAQTLDTYQDAVIIN